MILKGLKIQLPKVCVFAGQGVGCRVRVFLIKTCLLYTYLFNLRTFVQAVFHRMAEVVYFFIRFLENVSPT